MKKYMVKIAVLAIMSFTTTTAQAGWWETIVRWWNTPSNHVTKTHPQWGHRFE